MTRIPNTWSFYVGPAARGSHKRLTIDGVPLYVSRREARRYPAQSYQLPPAPCPPYIPLPGTSTTSGAMYAPGRSRPAPPLFPIDLAATTTSAVLTPYQTELLTDTIPAHTTVHIYDLASRAVLFEVCTDATPLLTADVAAFLHFLAGAPLPCQWLELPAAAREHGVARMRMRGGGAHSGPTGLDLLLGRTQLWSLQTYAERGGTWGATVDVVRFPVPLAPSSRPGVW
ncbi:hypothetical protein MKEN_00964200 [Mycena kentingensis (nom. inval.)]|nr:hypothetical protein MKEN_00964200 [Mycena kentingensis (nom. inval.)]